MTEGRNVLYHFETRHQKMGKATCFLFFMRENLYIKAIYI